MRATQRSFRRSSRTCRRCPGRSPSRPTSRAAPRAATLASPRTASSRRRTRRRMRRRTRRSELAPGGDPGGGAWPRAAGRATGPRRGSAWPRARARQETAPRQASGLVRPRAAARTWRPGAEAAALCPVAGPWHAEGDRQMPSSRSIGPRLCALALSPAAQPQFCRCAEERGGDAWTNFRCPAKGGLSLCPLGADARQGSRRACAWQVRGVAFSCREALGVQFRPRGASGSAESCMLQQLSLTCL
mmetsp:Transcript_67657/g.191703  ORF Transcript_67657/g.191703 Transcript_67657/m.191703 type:complete len:245 (+) Transcript_67657:305-1039(+)